MGLSPVHSQLGVFSVESRAQTGAHLDSSPGETLTTQSHGSNLAPRNLISPLTPRSQDGSAINLSISEASVVGRSSRDQSQAVSGPLQQPLDIITDSDFLANASHLTGGAIHFHRESNPADSTNPGIVRSITHKTRFFGQSHWINIFQMVRKIYHLALFRARNWLQTSLTSVLVQGHVCNE